MNVNEFITRLTHALECKTLYVNGCIGSPLTKAMKERYIRDYKYNSNPDRKAKINSATSDTFGFDCVCFIKSVLWGWKGDVNSIYGGADYNCDKNIPDTTIDELFLTYSTDQSSDFSNIEVGEFLIMDGHCGIYIGNGKAIECTPKWDDGVQISEVWNIQRTSSKGRFWTAHSKLLAVDYSKEEPEYVAYLYPQKVSEEVLTKLTNYLNSLGCKIIILEERS